MPDSTSPEQVRNKPDLQAFALGAKMRQRAWVDFVVRHAVTLGGIATIIAISVIFAYLLYVVLPLFRPATVEQIPPVAIANAHTPLYYAIEESGQLALDISAEGTLSYVSLDDGSIRHQHTVALADNTQIAHVVKPDSADTTLMLVASDGRVVFLTTRYRVEFDDANKRRVVPEVSYPYGDAWLSPFPSGASYTAIDAKRNDDALAIAAITDAQQLWVREYALQTSLFDDSASLEELDLSEIAVKPEHSIVVLDPALNYLLLATTGGHLALRDLRALDTTLLNTSVSDTDAQLTTLSLLNGGSSLLVGDDQGTITQWMLAKNAQNQHQLQRIRQFTSPGEIRHILPESGRKGFFSIDDQGTLKLFYTTSGRQLAELSLPPCPDCVYALAPRSDTLLAATTDRISLWQVDNQHPEISISALFTPVWYEGYTEKQFIWQSTAASSDFEPKYSLTPLLFGTLKAAFYALLFATPLAIMGAIYTAYFMAPRTRRVVKPSIEIMEAIPTVILGFLAGLWLAPRIEDHLPAVFALVLFLPLAVMGFAYLGSRLRAKTDLPLPDDWELYALIPLIIGIAALAFAISPWLESAFFHGDMRLYMDQHWGLDYDQRNALVVGIAMGFAVIPTIFSIAEDALFSVPKHLTQGALALGATPWQTLVRVVLPTASPAIFSAFMMGLGRAVGETMIILMATGNTPIMDMNIFEGMRTLSANIAVEMPESSVGSTHYRVLFLTALLLFVGTFLFNTLAETVRHRLRKKYSRF